VTAGNGVDLRLGVRGASGRTVVDVRFRRAGKKRPRHQQRVLHRAGGRHTLTFRLRGLTTGALYGYTVGVVSGRHHATLHGSFMVARGASRATVVTGDADTTVSGATLHATVAANGSATEAWFAWGDGAELSQETAHRAFTASADATALSDSVSGLESGHTYLYRVVSTNAGGTTLGAIRSFTTGTASSASQPPKTPPVTKAPPTSTKPPVTTTPPASPTPPAAPTPPPVSTPPPVKPPPIQPPPVVPSGPVYYVSTTGSDSGDGSPSSPWQTLAKAAAATPAGATAIVEAGSYAGFTMSRSGQVGAPIAIQAASAGSVQVTPPAGASTITIADVHDVTLSGLDIEGSIGTGNAGVEVLDGSSDITISGGTIANNHSYGVDVNGSTNVTISGNTITGNDTGIRINRAGAGVVIQGNSVVNNTGMVVDDPTPGNDWGAVGISFLHTVGPLVARGNTIHGNRGQSDDYGYDGGGFEIYGASGVTMTSNTIYDNQDVLETGTDGAACSGNVFSRNVAWGGNNKSLVAPRGPQVNGIILRCGASMLIANNTFEDLDYWVYDITTGGGFAGSIDGFRIENNVSYQLANKIYAIEDTLPAGAVIDYNVSYNSPGAPFASVPSNGNVTDIATFRSLTGQEAHGQFANPLFVSLSGHNFQLSAGSPAIDAGTQIGGVTGGFLGSAPDAGAYEHS
jgi:parallel beta-helix repeat protein